MAKTRTPSLYSRSFGPFARRLREARRQTQEQLAERAGLAADTIRRMEYGSFSPSLDTLIKFATGLRLDLSSLFTAFELREIGTDRELVAIVQSLNTAERAIAVRVLAVLADLLGAVAATDENGGEDA